MIWIILTFLGIPLWSCMAVLGPFGQQRSAADAPVHRPPSSKAGS